MLRLALSLIIILATLAAPANAHRLKLFAKTEAGTISGYGFFTGGSRPQGSEIIFADEQGKQLHRTKTSSDGTFSWRPASPGTYHLTLNTGEGHIAKTSVTLTTTSPNAALNANTKPIDLQTNIEQAVERAVEKHVNPLREKIEAYEAGLRFKDIVAGIALIIGLAGAAMWAVSRKSRP